MSFERSHFGSALACRSVDRPARQLGVVLKQIAAGEPRSRAPGRRRDGPDPWHRLEPRGRADRARPAPRDGRGRRSGRVGRPAQTLELADRVVAVGLEVNVDYLAVCVEDLTGAVRYERRVHTTTPPGPAPVLDRLARMAPRRSRRRREDLIACRCRRRAARASSRPDGHAAAAPNLGWSGAGRRRARARLPGLPSAPRTRRTSPRWPSTGRRRARACDNFVGVFGEVGVGAGIFVDGELFRGAHGFGGEFGHVTVDDGPPARAAGRAASRRSSARRRSPAGRGRVRLGGHTCSLTSGARAAREEG